VSNDTQPLNESSKDNSLAVEQELVEAGYPADDLAELVEDSQRQFEEALENHPDGDNWSDGSARDFRADVEWNLQDAIDAAEYGQFDVANKHLGDTMNYLLFIKAVVDGWEREATVGENESEVDA
jgi:hypothetical protein